eukprot:c18932_g1_i2 orf=66-497(+)
MERKDSCYSMIAPYQRVYERLVVLLYNLAYYDTGNWYKGDFWKDACDGWGVIYWPSISCKFEGEWVANCPRSGYYSSMVSEDYILPKKKLLTYYPPTLRILLGGAPEKEKQGQKLISHLEQGANSRSDINFENFLFLILQFHN